MTVTTQTDLLTLTIDGVETSVPKGTLLIRAAEELGVAVPRFCDHPLLDPVAACRACLVEIEGQAKPQPACAVTAADGMVVRTQLTSEVADKAQHGVLEFLLVNHPLDCPICDKGGECPLQNQAMSNGRADARFDGTKRTFPKPISISTNVLLDRERCVLCARCTRFSNQIAGDPFIELLERGALQQVGIYEHQPFESYFSGNAVQICPVGALTSASYRFRARPFDLMSTPSTCEHCAAGCAQRTDHRRGKVTRRLAGNDPAVNEEWNCDKGRWAFQYETSPERLTHPMVREESGELVPASWPAALAAAANGLAAARGRAGVLVGGRLTVEDAYAYAKFARVALGTNDVDFRARPHSAEEAEFLAARVAGTGLGVTYADLEQAPAVVLVGLEPEEEAPIVFLRLRKAVRKQHQRVLAVAPFTTRGSEKLQATLIPAAPGREVEALDQLAADTSVDPPLVPADAIVLVGERLAQTSGGLSAAIRLAETKSARLAWVPRRAGDRGAVEAGALPNLLPGGRPVADASARVDVQTVWGVEGLPAQPGRDGSAILAAAAGGELAALVVGGVDPHDLGDPGALAALDAVPFLVSLEIRSSAVTERADVVLPVASVTAKPSGTFMNWEGRERLFGQVFDSNLMTDGRALTALADELDVDLGLSTPAAARAELLELGQWEGTRASDPTYSSVAAVETSNGEVVLATWHHLLDQGRLQDDEPYLAGTARATLARLSPATAASVGVADGDPVTVSTEHGGISAPAAVTEMVDGVVWLPTNSAGSAVHRDLSATAGSIVRIAGAGNGGEA